MRIAISLGFFASLLAAQEVPQPAASCAAARIVVPRGNFSTPVVVPSETKDSVIATMPPCEQPEAAALPATRFFRLAAPPAEARKAEVLPNPFAAPAPVRKPELFPNPFAVPAPERKREIFPNPLAAPSPRQ